MKIGPAGGHADQLLRSTRAHHYALSSMADQKASMLLSVSAIVIPLTVRYLEDPILRFPAMTMIFFCVLTISLVAYASMPKIFGKSHATPGQQLFNPLFFGDFARLPYEEYMRHMEEVLSDPAHTYEAQVREVYVLGKYLAGHKYKYLRRGYAAFLSGAICSCAVWGGASIYQAWFGAL